MRREDRAFKMEKAKLRSQENKNDRLLWESKVKAGANMLGTLIGGDNKSIDLGSKVGSAGNAQSLAIMSGAGQQGGNPQNMMMMVGGFQQSESFGSKVANTVGAMTVAGTTYLANIASLVSSSDYVMVGEEQAAAGAYLSQDPVQLASIRTTDIIKIISIIILVLGILAINMGSDIFLHILSN